LVNLNEKLRPPICTPTMMWFGFNASSSLISWGVVVLFPYFILTKVVAQIKADSSV